MQFFLPLRASMAPWPASSEAKSTKAAAPRRTMPVMAPNGENSANKASVFATGATLPTKTRMIDCRERGTQVMVSRLFLGRPGRDQRCVGMTAERGLNPATLVFSQVHKMVSSVSLPPLLERPRLQSIQASKQDGQPDRRSESTTTTRPAQNHGAQVNHGSSTEIRTRQMFDAHHFVHPVTWPSG